MYAHAQAPVRIGIAGGGTDLPAWTAARVGRCLSLAIKMRTHAVAISRSDGMVVASYRRRDSERSATEIANGTIRESALMHGWETGFEVHTVSELTSRGSGLGVSSSIAVSLAACFRELNRLRGCDTWQSNTSEYLAAVARDAWRVEIDRLHRPIGRQDHMAAAHGGLRLYGFAGDDAEIIQSFDGEAAQWVADHLLLVPLGRGHDSREILASVKSPDALERASEAVPVAIQAIDERSVAKLGRALLMGQESKGRIRGAVPRWLDDLLAIIAGADGVHGCKVAGAGGGGHVVVACDPGSRVAVERAANLPVTAVQPDLDGVRSEGWA